MTAPRTGPWTILEVLKWTAGYFEEKGAPEPRASAEVLLAHTLGLKRLDLYLRYDQPLSPEELTRYKALITRRLKGEPVAYLTGHKEFWSLDFQVTPAVLIPRPETEVLVEAVVEVAKEVFGGGGQGSQTHLQSSPKPPPPTPYRGLGGEFEGRAGDLRSPGPPLKLTLPPTSWGLELGVGSGAVVVALARELSQPGWVAVDISAAALEVAQENARRHGVAKRVSFLRGNLLSGFKPGPWFALLVANLPYVSEEEWEGLPEEIRDYEPKAALLGGADGLALLRPLAQEAHRYLQPGGWLALEVGLGQAGVVRQLLRDTGAYERLEIIRDYGGIERVVRARKEGDKRLP